MRRFLSGVFIISFTASCYIFQQARLLEYSYLANSYGKAASLLVDQNQHLRYNITKLQAPQRLEGIMLTRPKNEVCMPREWRRIQINTSGKEITPAEFRPFINAGRIILSMFSLDTEAVAKE